MRFRVFLLILCFYTYAFPANVKDIEFTETFDQCFEEGGVWTHEFYLRNTQITINDCDPPIQKQLPSIDVQSHQLLAPPLLPGAAVSIANSWLTYTPPQVYVPSKDKIKYEIVKKDGSRIQEEIEIDILPCPKAETASTPNTFCNGECQYDGPSIMINEVMTTPREYNNSIYGQQCPRSQRGGGEWVELYNPDPCNPVDISGYFFGNAILDSPGCDGLEIRGIGGAFIFPEGTIVPPNGFCILLGEYGEEIEPGLLVENGGNTVQIKLMDYFDRFCIDAPGNRFWLPDMGGWFALYNRNGVPQDAIYWGETDADICADCPPCNPKKEGFFMGELPALNAFPADRQHRIRYAINYSRHEGKTPKRIPDGGEWSYTTYTEHNNGYCNAGCTQRFSDDCDGTATVTALTTGNYSYLWNDSKAQTTPTATGLCEGTYCCTITDNDTQMTTPVCVTVEKKLVTEESTVYLMPGESYQFGDRVLNSTGIYERTEKGENNCDKRIVLDLRICSTEEQITATICKGESYNFYGQNLTTGGVYTTTIKNVNSCGNTITLTLTVHPTDNTYLDAVIRDTETYLFAGKELSQPGTYTDRQKNIYGCDSIITLNLRMLPDVIAPPEAFTPNGDSKNDYFEIPNLELYPNNSILIFNRWGNKVFEASPYNNDWDGRNHFGIHVGGDLLPAGTYFYILNLGDGTEPRKGYVYVSRE